MVILWCKIQRSSVHGVRDILCVLTSISGCRAMCLLENSKGVQQSLHRWLSAVSGHVHIAVEVQVI